MAALTNQTKKANLLFFRKLMIHTVLANSDIMEGGNVGSPRDTSGRGRHRHLKVPLSGRGNPATRGRWDDVHDVRPSTMSVPGGDVPLGGRTQLLLLESTHTQLLQRAGWALGQALDRGPARLSVLHLRQLSCQLECQLSSWTVS